jgi:hypothetical protein
MEQEFTMNDIWLERTLKVMEIFNARSCVLKHTISIIGLVAKLFDIDQQSVICCGVLFGSLPRLQNSY